jgi:ABC-2 type transport system ATP-binding protein
MMELLIRGDSVTASIFCWSTTERSSMSTPLISFENVSARYLKRTYTIDLYPETTYLISGANGSGKTTFLKLLLGLISPKSGKITRGEKLSYSYLPEVAELPPYIRCFSYLETIAKIRKCRLDLQLINDFELPIHLDINLLSKGNRQKLNLVAALLGTSSVICLDEPLSGLDEKARNVFADYLRRLDKSGSSLLISSHNSEAFGSLKPLEIRL